MARQQNAGTIINRTAVEVGLLPVADPFSSTDAGFTQLTALLNIAGLELAAMFEWQELTSTFSFNTTADIVAGYAQLPNDYDRFIQQTGWDYSNEVPVIGPLSPQQWSYMIGRQLITDTIYVSYRINKGQIEIFPNPPPTNATVTFQYISTNWATNALEEGIDFCTVTGDVVLLDSTLMQKFLKVKFLDAKNLPSSAAHAEFENLLQNRLGNQKGGQILHIGGVGRYPLLNMINNVPDTGYGF